MTDNIGLNVLRIDDPAPDFRARTTLGERTLSAYRGRWLVFFSHPADFTPVCTSEFVALAKAAERFAALNCDLLGLSVDSLYAHFAWVRDMEERLGVTIPFPIVEDPSMAIARAYGMLDEMATDSATVRATYFIDPEGIIRALLWYPMTVGRSVEEILRLLTALQTADATKAVTPEGWRNGEPVLEPAPVSVENGAPPSEGETWYFRRRRS